MAWSDNPQIRDLKPYADKHGFRAIIAVCIMDNGQQFAVNSYGKTAQLCKAAGKVCDRIFEEISSGKIEIPDCLLK